jgi:putative hydrolase of the HAD superfamily
MVVRAVFFDAGETLVHPYPSFPDLFSQVLRRHGRVVEPEEVLEHIVLVFDHFADAAQGTELWTTSPERSRVFWHSVYRALGERLDVERPDELADALYTEFTTLANWRLFDDVLPVLRRLKEHGLVLGLVSNFEEWLEQLLERLAVTGMFDAVVISGLEGLEKPDPAIFRLALARAGVTASESAYVGDNPAFDTEPAEALGMTGVLIDRRRRFPDHDGLRVETLADLPAVLDLPDAEAARTGGGA